MIGFIKPLNFVLSPEAELHPGEKSESDRDGETQPRIDQAGALQQVHHSQQNEPNSDR